MITKGNATPIIFSNKPKYINHFGLYFMKKAITTLLLTLSTQTLAAYPEKAITMIIPFPPGQATDTLGRALADQLSNQLKQPIVVINKAGAGSNIGMKELAKSAPDGYTIALGGSAAAINQSLYKNPGYNLQNDLSTVSGFFSVPLVFLATPESKILSLQQLINHTKETSDVITYASAGIGGTQHLSAEILQTMTNIKMRHIPYKGSANAQADFLGNHVPLMVDSVTSALPHIKAGKAIPLAVTSKNRLDTLPNVPSVSELVTDYETLGWAAIFVPKQTPKDIQLILNKEINKALSTTNLQEFLKNRGATPMSHTLDEANNFINAEIQKWGEAVKTSGTSIE